MIREIDNLSPSELAIALMQDPNWSPPRECRQARRLMHEARLLAGQQKAGTPMIDPEETTQEERDARERARLEEIARMTGGEVPETAPKAAPVAASEPATRVAGNARPVICIDDNDREWQSVTAASEHYKISSPGIYNALRTGKPVKGYRFRYLYEITPSSKPPVSGSAIAAMATSDEQATPRKRRQRTTAEELADSTAPGVMTSIDEVPAATTPTESAPPTTSDAAAPAKPPARVRILYIECDGTEDATVRVAIEILLNTIRAADAA